MMILVFVIWAMIILASGIYLMWWGCRVMDNQNALEQRIKRIERKLRKILGDKE